MVTVNWAPMGMGRANFLGSAAGGCGATGQCGLFHRHIDIGLVARACVNMSTLSSGRDEVKYSLPRFFAGSEWQPQRAEQPA